MWGVIPAAGPASRGQRVYSRELAGSRIQDGVERPKALSELIVERMLRAGADKLCFVVSPGMADIERYYGSSFGGAQVCFVVQPEAAGLCDALFRARALVGDDEAALVGLPDTVWFPEEGFRALHGDDLSFLLFPVSHPERFDAVLTDEHGQVREIRVKQAAPGTNWVWGAFRLSGHVLGDLHQLWLQRERSDTDVGTLVNAYIARGGHVTAIKAGHSFHDVGTPEGYREALRLLGGQVAQAPHGALSR